eukprot:1619444-Pleurochrysis_carterae.AAC.3
MPSSTPNEVFSTCERRKDCVLPDGHGGKCECAKEGDFIVESILDEKIARGKRKFLIKWKGWSKEHDTWEPIENLTGCPDILKRWLATHPSPSAPSPVPLSAGQTVLHASPKSLGANMTKASSTPKAAGTHHASESSFVPLQGGEVSAAVKKRRLEANSNNEQAMPKFKTPPATAAAKKWPSEANSASAGQPAPQQPAKPPLKSSTPASAKQRAKLQANPQAKQPGKPQVQELAKSIAKTSSKSASKPASKPKDGLAGKQRKLAGKPSSKASSTSTIGPAAEKGNQPVEKLVTKPDVHSDQASATQRDLSPATKQASKQTSKPVAKPEKGQDGPSAATLSSSKPASNAAIATKAAAKTEKIAAKPTGHGTSSQTQVRPSCCGLWQHRVRSPDRDTLLHSHRCTRLAAPRPQGTPCWLFQGTRLRTSHDGTGSLQKVSACSMFLLVEQLVAASCEDSTDAEPSVCASTQLAACMHTRSPTWPGRHPRAPSLTHLSKGRAEKRCVVVFGKSEKSKR